MEISLNKLAETEAHSIQKGIVNKAVNWGASDYIADQRMFKKSAEEKAKLANLKHQWLKEMRVKYPDFKKRKSTKKEYLQTILKK